jgi:hypothetical protein
MPKNIRDLFKRKPAMGSYKLQKKASGGYKLKPRKSMVVKPGTSIKFGGKK